MASNDLFAPVTEEEKKSLKQKDMFSPLSKDEKLSIGVRDSDIQPNIAKTFLGIGPKLGMAAAEKVGELYNKYIDPYSGAPVRSGLMSKLKGGSFSEGYSRQFGEDSALSPRGEEIASQLGIRPGPYGLVGKGSGLAIEMATDPVNYIPYGLLMRGASKATGVAKGLVSGASEAMTGVPASATKTYMSRTPEVNELIAKYGEDIPAAADKIRTTISHQIQTKRTSLNNQITDALSKSSSIKSTPSSSVLSTLEKMKERVNPLKTEEIKDIDEMISRVKSLSDEKGNLNVKDMFNIKDYLQGLAKGTYQKGNQIYVVGDTAKLAAKSAAAEARRLLNAASPEIALANNEHTLLHNVDQMINKNIITPGKSEAGLLRAGAGQTRERKMLEAVENAVGSKMVPQAENLYAMKQFASPKLYNPQASRSMIATGVGFLAGGKTGAVVAGAVTSPAALKLAVNTGRIPVSILEGLTGIKYSEKTLKEMSDMLSTPTGHIITSTLLSFPASVKREGLINE